jgi:predicted RNA methylase
MDINNFGLKIKTLSQNRLDEMGEIPSGLFNYYKLYYLNNDFFYLKNEIVLMNYINEKFDKNIKCFEIAAGCGQVSLGLSNIFKFNNIYANEWDKRRLNYGEYLNVNNNNKVSFIKEDFRKINFNNYDLIIIGNIRHKNIGITDNEYIQFIDFLKAGKTIILQPNYYGIPSAENNIYHKITCNSNIDIEYIHKASESEVIVYNGDPHDIVKISYKN